MQISDDDIRSAVAAGILNEAQAASLTALAAARHGQREALPADEEPFEFFRGFAEIFVSVGLILLISGILAFTSVAGSVLMPAITAALCWTFARYFTLRRRMSLPSSAGELLGPLCVLGMIQALTMAGVPALLIPIALVIVAGLLAAFTVGNTYALVLLTGREGRATSWREALNPLLGGLLVAFYELLALAALRVWAETALGVRWPV